MKRPKIERTITVDEASFELANHFLHDISGANTKDVWALAVIVQEACEDFCRNVEERQKAKATA